MHAANKRFTYDGDKDKNEARTMSDRLDDPDGFRTSIVSLPDEDIMLRTRGGNPEVTTTKKAAKEHGPIVERKYELRVFHAHFANSIWATLAGLPRLLKYVSAVITSAGRLTFNEPPGREVTDKTASYYAPSISRSSDNLFSLPSYAPRGALLNGEKVAFSEMSTPPTYATLEELSAVVTGKMRRTFFPAKVMRPARATGVPEWPFVFLINAVKVASARIGPRPVRIKFKEPVADTSDSSSRDGIGCGKPGMKSFYLDFIRVWGQPYHGKKDHTGKFTMANGRVINTGCNFSGVQSQIVKFDGTPVSYLSGEAVEESLSEKGLEWRNYALLGGDSREYDPVATAAPKISFGTNSWLYRSPDKTVWVLRLRANEAGRAWVEAWVADTYVTGESYAPTEVLNLGNVDTTLLLYTYSQPTTPHTALSASEDGKKASYPWYSGTGLPEFGSPSVRFPTVAYTSPTVSSETLQRGGSLKYSLFTVSGGSATTPPTIVHTMVTGANDPDVVYTAETYALHTEATVSERRKIVQAVWYKPSGELVKMTDDITITRTFIAGREADLDLSVPTNVSRVQTSRAGSAVIETRTYTLTTVPTLVAGTTDRYTYTSITHSGHVGGISPGGDGSTGTYEYYPLVGGTSPIYGAYGALGQKVVLSAPAARPYGQHPVTGELAFDCAFF